MTNKPLTKLSTRSLPVCRFLVIPALMLGVGSDAFAQAPSYTWNDTISFSGMGVLDTSPYTGAPDPILNLSMTGTGQDQDTLLADLGGGVGYYGITSSFQTVANITSFPGALGSLPISPSAPASGPDPGLTLTAAPNANFGFAFLPPFFNLFPPPGGTDYSDIITSGVTNNFQYGANVLYVGFAGETDLTLGSTPVLTSVTPDPFIIGDDFYTYTYADTTLALTTSIGEPDPSGPFPGTLTFTGNFNITVAAAPDSSPGLAGVLALLGVCAGGVWQKRAKAA